MNFFTFCTISFQIKNTQENKLKKKKTSEWIYIINCIMLLEVFGRTNRVVYARNQKFEE